MRALIRETALQQLQRFGPLVDAYQRGEPTFVDQAVQVLRRSEEALARMRLPEASVLATRRGLILAARDGYRPDTVAADGKRKVMRAVTMTLLTEAEQLLSDLVSRHEAWLEPMQEKMDQLVAVGVSEGVIPLPPTEPRSRWVATVWKQLAGANGRAMHAYLSTALAASDRDYLLSGALTNLEGGLALAPGPTVRKKKQRA